LDSTDFCNGKFGMLASRVAVITSRKMSSKSVQYSWEAKKFRCCHVTPAQQDGNRTFRPFTGRFDRPLDVSPTHWTFRPRLWTFRPRLLFYVFVVFFYTGHVARINKLIGWWIDVLSLLPSHCTFTQLHTTLLYFVETSMMKLLMLSKIASIINCLFISCEIVMPRSWKCCTLSTMTGLLVEQSDKCWGRHFVHFARWPRIMKCLSSFCLGCPRSATAEGMSACEFAVNHEAEFYQVGIVHILMGEAVNSEIIN